MARAAKTLVVAKGKKIVRLDMKKDAPTDADLKALIIGTSGKLRAPSILKGTTFIVGFNDAMFDEVFGG